MPPLNQFFDEATEQSCVKLTIVTKYFFAWARVMLGHLKKRFHASENLIAYIDLFSGPGRYKDGTESTPILILKKAIQSDDLREHLVTIFIDKRETYISSLRKTIEQIPNVGLLKHQPQTECLEINAEIIKVFEQLELAPTLFFVDPWGYKGLSLRLIRSMMKDWGCECIFFFNYNRINMGLNNPLFKEHMASLFGEDRAGILGQYLETLPVHLREMAIIENLCQALKSLDLRYVLPFRFKDDMGTRTSHHLIFVSRAFKGYEIMKEIMAKECSNTEQGMPSFEYNPADAHFAKTQPLLFQLAQPIDDLSEMLLAEFAGQSLTMKDIYEQHNVGRPFIKRNYRTVLIKLENEKKIIVPEHRKGTFADDVIVTFPPRKGGIKTHGF